jgi:molybdopterin-guanine dinucleotide biosynthesis protein A
MTTGGIILCGGRSSRMGRPKAWLPFAGETLLQRTARTLRAVLEPVIVVAAPGQDVPPLPAETRIVRDEVEGKGPLGGLAAGLAALEGEVDAVYLSACDTPFLKAAFVRRVVSFTASGDHQIAVPCLRENRDLAVAARQPLAAVYRVSVLPVVRELLAADRLRMLNLLEMVPTRMIEAHEFTDVDPDLLSLRNVNTPEEYEAACLQLPFLSPDP